MDDMIERVARAIFEKYVVTFIGYGGPREWSALDEAGRQFAFGLARVAIEAMREPTPDMCFAGMADQTPRSATNSLERQKEALTHIWRAMIDTALKPTEG